MKAPRFLLASLLLLGPMARDDDAASPPGPTRFDLEFRGGHETDPRDRGRPVVLVASALDVPPDFFREAFSHVHPAPAGEQPQPDDVRQNKRELLSRLAPFGVTNERLDEVSNYYRYRRESGEIWQHVDAAGYVLVQRGKIVSVTITNPGAGYTTPPVVSVPGVGLTVYLLAQLALGTDLAKNGSVAKIEVSPICDGRPPPSSSQPSSPKSGIFIRPTPSR